MSDETLQRLAAYADSLAFDDLPAEVIHQAKRVIIDSLGCGLGAFTSEPAKMARDLAETFTGTVTSTVLGSAVQSTPELAAFANGTMIRYLDFNDSYGGKDTAHPSDNLAAVLAAAEAYGATGRDLIVGFVAAWEVQAAWADSFRLREGGPWDQGAYAAISTALGAGLVMGLGEDELANAVSLAVVQGLPLGEARRGTLSHWKAAAVPNAGRAGVFAAMLAERGLTGPGSIFSGEEGFFAGVSRGPFTLPPLAGEGGAGRRFRIMASRIKRFPAGFFSQTAIEAALEAREALGVRDASEVRRVHVRTFRNTIEFMAGDPTRWRPATRETADHSLPYVVACALRYGAVNVSHFDDEVVQESAMADLMDRVSVELDQECEAAWPGATLNIVTVETTDGRTHTARVGRHLGHPERPMSDEDIAGKFRGLTRGLLTRSQQDEALGTLWRLDDEEDLWDVMRLLTV